jgi:hypothetical protein|tara:strand:+ start:1620 stop:1829 length:210 start_codon:yes stop_codon:yes gene_type:complete
MSVISHLSDEQPSECPECNLEDCLVKVLTSFTTPNKSVAKPKVGQITEEFIQEAKQDLDQQKNKLEKNR